MENIRRLRDILIRALASQDSHHNEQELFDELMVQKQRLLKLFDVGQRNPQEQSEVESGKTTINGKPVAVNADFARQVVFLSQQLECSEKYVAALLHTVMTDNPNIGAENCLEVTVANFHQRRRHLADCLRYLFEAAEAAESGDAVPMYGRINSFALSELVPGVPVQGGEVTLAYRIFKEIEHMDSVIARADAIRKNAGTNTIASSGQGNSSLGYDILNARYDSLKYERRYLANALCSIARLGYLSPNEVKTIVEWLSTSPNHSMTFYMLTAVLVALDPADPQSTGGRIRQLLATDTATLTFMTRKLAPATEWKEPGLKATILLKWTLFLTEARHRDPSLEHRVGYKTEELEAQVWNAVQSDAFAYLGLAILQLQRKRGSTPAASFINALSLSQEQQEQRDIPTDDFKISILSAFEALVRSLITHASSELRKIKQRQEDLVLASARTDRARTSSARFAGSLAPNSDKPLLPPRNDIAALYAFIGLLYSALPPERALQFWGAGLQGESNRTTYLEYVESTAGKLPAFLQWAVWSTSVHDIAMSTALYEMLSGLAKGQQCSELAYNFMARGSGEVIPGSVLPSSTSGGPSVSWTVIFGFLDSWASGFTNSRNQGPSSVPSPNNSHLGTPSSFHHSLPARPQQPQQPQPITIGPKEVLLAQSFLRLLSTVVSHSTAVRVAVSGHAQFRAVPTLVSLIPCGIPLELKGALFETLAAFCEPGAGTAGVEICRAIWTLMERLEVINVRVGPTGGFGSALSQVKGVEVELDEIESVHRIYPSTIPFLKLLGTLIHTPKRVPLKDRVADVEPINTIPESLGQPYRLPGIGPFASFVIDNVFANISTREYSRPSDRWQTNDFCLCFVERALASYDLESLLAAMEDAPTRGEALVPLLVHPGYDMMKRMLTSSPLQTSILSYIVEGVEGFERELSEEEPFFRSTIVRVLRIVHRILEIQDIFLDVLVPLLLDFDSASIVGTVHSRSYFTKFDQSLSFNPHFVPSIAAYMAYPTHAELVLLSVKIIAQLSSSSSFTNFVSLIGRSANSERILGGFMQIINVESMEDIWNAEAVAEQTTGAGAPEIDGIPEALEQAIRLVALDLLIQNTESSRSYPNIAHFLLFGGEVEHQVQDPHALGARQTSIHVLLELLNNGIPRLNGKGKERDQQYTSQPVPLFVSLPGLAERCYRVIYQLCVHPRTSDFMTRYLRTREDFFARQLLSVPAQVPETLREPYIQVLYGDGSRVTTTVSSLSSFLRLRSCVFDLVALELHILTNKGHFKGVSQLLEILFGNDISRYENSSDDDIFQPFHEVGQSHMRVIDLLQSLTFDWSDSLTVQPIQLQFLGQLNLQSCTRRDSTGCEIVDRGALLALLAAARRALHTQGAIVTSGHADQLTAETTYILESCAVENHRREVTHAVGISYEAWRRLLDMTLTKCFDRLPHDHRENMLFDLLHVLPPAIRSTDVEESTAVLLSETVLSSITKLREDRRHQVIIQSAGGDEKSGSLPAERLFTILRSILEGILENNRLEFVRGNLYASLINYVHLITSRRGANEAQRRDSSLALSLSSSTMRDDFMFSTSQSIVPLNQTGGSQQSSPSLESGSLAVMKNMLERLVATISRDAIDGTEVWKTVAFTLLDALVQLSGVEKPHVVLSALARHGILSNFVRGVKDSDLRLQSVLKPDPDDLNPLYVYEAKMSFFIRMSQTRLGAERLLEAQLIHVLARCDYLDARPEADQSFMDRDSFLPSAIQRYHQLFMPALQLVDGMLATLGTKHATVVNQALDFLSNHCSTIVILLKTEDDYIPLSLLEEIHLIVALCASVLPSVPKSELLSSNSGFGSIHAAILSLSARWLSTGSFTNIVPQTDAEVLDANIYVFGSESETKFGVNVRQKERLLRKGLVIYIGAASEFTEPELILVFSPVTLTPRHDERGSHFLATIPTIGDALEALNMISGDLAETLKQIADLSAELSARDHIAVDNIQEIVQDIPETLLRELDIGQKRSLICRELEHIKHGAKGDAKLLLGTLEMVLLLLWRHLQYYSEMRNLSLSSSQIKSASVHAVKFLTAPEPEAFRAEVGRKLTSVLQRLSTLDMDYNSLGHDWQASQGYIEIMCRRLRDSAGLHDEQFFQDVEY